MTAGQNPGEALRSGSLGCGAEARFGAELVSGRERGRIEPVVLAQPRLSMISCHMERAFLAQHLAQAEAQRPRFR